jgi:hypothetical protein
MIKVNLPSSLPSFRFKVQADTKFTDLLNAIVLKLPRLAPEELQVWTGYPHVLVFGTSNESLDAVGINAGDSVTVKTGSPPSLRSHSSVSIPQTSENSENKNVHEMLDVKTMIDSLLSLGFSKSACEKTVAIVGCKMDSESYNLAVETCSAVQLSMTETNTSTQVISSKVMRRLVIDADNSCLLRAIGFAVDFERNGTKTPSQVRPDLIRQSIAEVVLSSAAGEIYSEAILGMSRTEYTKFILNAENWCGELEISILATLLSVRIRVLDVRSQILLPYAGPEAKVQETLYLLYDGIHYDCLVQGPKESDDVTRTLFDANDADIERQCRQISHEAKEARSYTNTKDKKGGFCLRCLVCGAGMAHAEEASAHAATTGHQNYGQI